MGTQEADADALMAKVEKRLNTYSFFTRMETKLEEAEEDYQKAANLYKVAKNYAKAAKAFEELADVRYKLDDKYQAATAYTDGANAYKKAEDAAGVVKCWGKAVDVYTDIGKFTNAAKVLKLKGEHLDTESDIDGAIQAFDLAADYYAGESSDAQANACRILSAALYASKEDYPKAIEIYEKVGVESLDNNLTKFNAKEHLFKAGLCHLCTGDLVAAERSITRYSDWDVSFNSQRENKLLLAILNAFKENDIEEFTMAVAEFDAISKLDAWKTNMLLRIKTAIKAQEDDLL